MMGRYPNTYQPHPDKAIEEFVFELFSDALRLVPFPKSWF